MDDQQRRIRDDLRDIVAGDVKFDDITCAAYSTDASILQQRPMGMVAPRDVDEIAEVVKYAVDNSLTIHPRGGGTGMAGESLGPGIILDTSRHMNRIVETGERTVRVEPGVRLSDLQSMLMPRQRLFPPDPVSREQCTIGGMLATDAAGPHSLRYGTTRNYVSGLKVVLSNGSIVAVGRETLGAADEPSDKQRLVRAAHQVCTEYRDAIAAEQPVELQKSGGYNFKGVFHRDKIDLAQLLVGSEGTLAIFAEAELTTLPIPRHRGIVLAFFSSLNQAALGVLESLEYQPTACELLDRRLISLLRDANRHYRQWIPANAETMLLIEQEGNSEGNLHDRLRNLADRLTVKTKLAVDTVELSGAAEYAESWAFRNQATPKLGDVSTANQPIAFVENTSVAPAKLPDYLHRVQAIMNEHGVTASYAVHAGVGVVHARPLLDLDTPAHLKKLSAISEDLFGAVCEFKGSFNSEHGVGLLRSHVLPRQYPQLYPAFRQLKAAFDPHNVLNPGRIVGGETAFPVNHLRVSAPTIESAGKLTAQLRWNNLPVLDTAERCNGCASCHDRSFATRMCPTYKVFQSEESGPRSKANLLRQAFAGTIDPAVVTEDRFREFADSCIHCKMCKLECPNSVDVSRLVLEARGAFVAEHGLQRRDWFFANLEAWSKWCSNNALIANKLLGNKPFRWIAERFWGLSRHRQIPRFHRSHFLRRAARHGWTRKPGHSDRRRKVAVFADSFVNFQDPKLGEYAVRVLEQLDLAVYVPPEQTGSGMSALRYGDIETAREYLETNIDTFAELAREGFDIVTPEPAAALMFRDDGATLTENGDLERIAEKTFEFSEYLAYLFQHVKIDVPELKPVPLSVGYHEPCYQRALQPRASVSDLFELIPQLRAELLDLGCSGMAQTFGMQSDGYDLSQRAGAAVLDRFRRDDLSFGVTQCTGCRLQIEQGTQKRTLHPTHWFAIALGLVSQPERLLRGPAKGLIS